MLLISLEHQRDINTFLHLVAERVVLSVCDLVEDSPEVSFNLAQLRRGSLSHDLVLLATIAEGKPYHLTEQQLTFQKRVFYYLDLLLTPYPEVHEEYHCIRRVEKFVNEARLHLVGTANLLTVKQSADLIGLSEPTFYTYVDLRVVHPIIWQEQEYYDRYEVVDILSIRHASSYCYKQSGNA